MLHTAKSSFTRIRSGVGHVCAGALAAGLAVTIALPAPAETPPGAPVVTAVPQLDLDRYMGNWYEIARLPNRHEDACARDVVHRYQRRSETAVGVTSICRRSDGEEAREYNVARVRDVTSHARLEIRHAPSALGWLPFVWEDYWVLEIGAAYDVALVGDQDHATLWILSRTPSLDRARYVALVSKAAALGYDTRKLIEVPQGAPANAATPAPR
ncbi:MAG: lipocalin family protein [Proteobacteria bacterium]|nr:lipocalin family protein [Pseudomonadota bacterium]